MTESSNTCDEHGADDIRNCVGYAIKQIQVGAMNASDQFVPAVNDSPDQPIASYCSSSIDPWH
jgi:hypothetical protein